MLVWPVYMSVTLHGPKQTRLNLPYIFGHHNSIVHNEYQTNLLQENTYQAT